MFEPLKLSVRTEVGIAIVESNDESDCDERFIFIEMVEEGSTVSMNV